MPVIFNRNHSSNNPGKQVGALNANDSADWKIRSLTFFDTLLFLRHKLV